MNLVLIGPRGAGKSKVSRALSKKIEFPVLSTDSLAVYELGGLSIPAFIEKSNGNWAEFRALEKRILQKLTNAKDTILDCGGGILFDIDSSGKEAFSVEKMEMLRTLGKVIYLEKEISDLVEKVQGDKTRPDLSKTITYRTILENRLPYYRKASHFSVSMDKVSKEDAASQILSLVGWKEKLG